MTDNARTGPGRWGVYTDSRPKDKISDPGFARALGLLEAVVMQLDRDLSEDAGIALGWAVLELSDFSELEAAEVVGYDLSGRDVREVLDEARAGVAQLAGESVELGTTLRYLRTAEHLREAIAATQPWLEDPGAAWHLLGDTARALEAVVVLDVALGRTGVLADDERRSTAPQNQRDWSRAEQRMVTSQVARAAGWYASDTRPDLATPTSTSRTVVRGPWEPIHELTDLAGGQRQLANLIQAPHEADSFASTLRSMDARTAFSLIRAQQQVCGQLRDICGAEPATAPDLATTFERYRSTYTELLPHIRCLADVEDRGVNQPALMQQHEITTFLGRNLNRAAELSTAELLEVAAGTHGVLREFAHATRRELDRDAGTLRQADPLRVQPPHRIGRKNPAYRAPNAASATPPPPRH